MMKAMWFRIKQIVCLAIGHSYGLADNGLVECRRCGGLFNDPDEWGIGDE